MKAKEASSTAPASLTGLKIADRETQDDGTWSDENHGDNASKTSSAKSTISIAYGACDYCGADPAHLVEAHHHESASGNGDVENVGDGREANSRMSLDSTNVSSSNEVISSSVSIKSRRSFRGRPGTISSALNPSPSKPSVSSQPLSALDASISVPTRDSIRPPHACRSTVRLLLSQLTEMHDKQQTAQKAEWDVFLRRRRRNNSNMSTTGNTYTKTTIGSRAATMLGIAPTAEDEEITRAEGFIGVAQMGLSSNKDDWKEFLRLVRTGIPLCYRAKVWSECSGALEAAEPGVFQELLSSHEGKTNATLADIEKDVRRTSELHSVVMLCYHIVFYLSIYILVSANKRLFRRRWSRGRKAPPCPPGL
jgi:small G protein signaling modulator 3